jgi:hypothetical protein
LNTGRPNWPRFLLVLMLALGLARAPLAQQEGGPPPLKPEEIEALVAPIALYPDALLSQVLMASTYPLEVVQAARWVKANPDKKGDAAVKAVESQNWDVSVKSLVAFPQALEPMDAKLDWTQKLGDAFLADQKAVLDAVQRLRAKANQTGNLKSNEQQKVIVETPAPQQTVIVIEPANPQVIYVPAYNPTVVYGGWAYPSYPPYYWPPSPYYYPGGALAAGFAWGVGLAAAGAIFGGCNWRGGNVDIDINRVTNIDRNFDRSKVNAGNNGWQHDASHRKGVEYRDSATRDKFSRDTPGADRRQDYRGREGAGAGERGGDRAGDRAGASDRAGVSDRAAGGGDRGPGDRGAAPLGDRSGAGVSDRSSPGGRADSGAGVADRSAGSAGTGASNRSAGSAGAGRDSAFQGVGGGSASQRDFDRGSASVGSAGGGRASAAPSRSGGGYSGGGFSGGGARAGGGARGGGGRR